MSKLKNCPSCNKEVAKSAKTCPNCGKKLKMGLFLKGIIGLVILSVLVGIFGPSDEEKANQAAAELSSIAQATPVDISQSELADMFNLMSDATDLQRENKLKEINGQIVRWTLPVYEVNRSGDTYRIQTSSRGDTVGTFITIKSPSAEDESYLSSLDSNSSITVQGKINGSSLRHIEIEPAVIIK